MVILKFGGSSVATLAAIDRVAGIVDRQRQPTCVVVSALAGVTDALVDVAHLGQCGHAARAVERLGEIATRHAVMASRIRCADARAALQTDLDGIWLDATARVGDLAGCWANDAAASDALVASGELASSRIVQALLRDRGLPASWIDARLVVVTDARHGQATPIEASIRERAGRVLRPVIDRGDVAILGGFIGSTPDGATTTLGRGGSDYSASLVGAALGATEVQIWTDVDGMLTADPRTVRGARLVTRLSYAEASALAHFGAKVLHPSTVRPAVAADIPVRILNSFEPAGLGTLITSQVVDRRAPLAGLAATFGDVRRQDGLAIVAAVGENLRRSPTLCAAILRALDGIPLHRVVHASGGCYIGAVVAERRVGHVMSRLHARFFESERDAARVSATRHSLGRRDDSAGAPIASGLPATARGTWT